VRRVGLVCGLLLGCGPQEERPPTLGLLAPRALQPVLDPAVGQWEDEHEVEVFVGYDTPDRLQRQADGGTRADLFIAADHRWMDALQADGHVHPDDRHALAHDPLVFVSRDPRSLARDPVELVGAVGDGQARIGLLADELPEGIVARQALEDTRVWHQIEESVVRFANSDALRDALQDGEVGIGVCRRSSVMAAYDTLSTHPFTPDQRYGSVVEVAAMRRPTGESTDLAQLLVDALRDGPGARENWQQAGLVVSGGPQQHPPGPQEPPRHRQPPQPEGPPGPNTGPPHGNPHQHGPPPVATPPRQPPPQGATPQAPGSPAR